MQEVPKTDDNELERQKLQEQVGCDGLIVNCQQLSLHHSTSNMPDMCGICHGDQTTHLLATAFQDFSDINLISCSLLEGLGRTVRTVDMRRSLGYL